MTVVGHFHEQLGDLRFRRLLRHENNRRYANRRREACQRRRRVARRGGPNRFGTVLDGFHHAHGTGAIFERSGGQTSIIFDPHVLQLQKRREPIGFVERRATYGERRHGAFRLDRQQRPITPDRPIGVLFQHRWAKASPDELVVVLHIDDTFIAVIGTDVVDFMRRIFFAADQTLE